MGHIPIMLNVPDKKVLIIGGGEVAARKAEKILERNVGIRMISSEFSSLVSSFDVEKIVMEIKAPSEIQEYAEDSAFVIIATDDIALNDKLEAFCIERNILYNRVDEQKSPLIFPATFESDGVVVSVSTSGKSPSLARYIRDMLHDDLKKYSVALPVAERLRKEIKMEDFHKKAQFFRTLFEDEEFWALLRSGDSHGAYEFGKNFSTAFLSQMK